MQNLPANCPYLHIDVRIHILHHRVGDGSIIYYIGIMENKMETTIMENQMEKKMENEMETTIMENQMEKKMENEMETGII